MTLFEFRFVCRFNNCSVVAPVDASKNSMQLSSASMVDIPDPSVVSPIPIASRILSPDVTVPMFLEALRLLYL